MIPPVVAVVGYADSGKTAVASHLVAALSEQGYRVAAVKDCPHGHDINRVNSDSDRLYNAGAVVAVASSPDLMTTLRRPDCDTSLESIISDIGSRIDIVIAEGFKTSSFPKVLVCGPSGSTPDVENIIAVVSSKWGKWSVPAYSPDELPSLAEQVMEQFLLMPLADSPVYLEVDGFAIPLKQYPARALTAIVQGFVSSLNAIPEQPGEIIIRVRPRGPQSP